MKKRIRSVALVFFVALVVIPCKHDVAAQPKEKETKRSPVMVRKLVHAQALLQGIAVQDFDGLARNADALIQCREETTWRLNVTEQYEFHSNAFLEHLLSLKAAAKKKDVEAATLAYLGVARTCIKCHENLRPDRKDN